MKRRISVAVLGPEGTFTEIAAKKIFKNADFGYCSSVEDVFESVKSGMEFGVVAIENSLEGSVNVTMDCLVEYNVKIYKEMILDIKLCIAAMSGTKNIKTILSHPHAIAQCRKFLKENFPKARLQGYDSTAAAMQKLKVLKNSAAIGPEETAKLHGLKILHKNTQDSKSQTRFIVIRNSKEFRSYDFAKQNHIISKKYGSGNKTSIIFAVKDIPGALYSVLREFAEKKINLKKIESRPSKRKLGEYLFFVDFEGNLEDKKVKDVLKRIRSKTTFLKVLGSY